MAHALALEDTVVVDDPDVVPLPVRSRTSTDGALTMQVLVEGSFHRRIAPGSSVPALSRTSCDKPIHSQFAPTRREELCHPLCRDGCFTDFELRLADERRRAELAETTDPKEDPR